MNVESGQAEAARQWSLRSDQFLDAARHLPVGRDDMHLPRAQLLGRALEYRFKAYLCASRGGAPETEDLSRLAVLAAYCGLVLSTRERRRIAWLDRCRLAAAMEGTAPELDWVPALCATIDGQASDAPGAGGRLT